MKTLIIAEAGANHNQDLNIAKQLVDEAFLAGCDICKFQTYTAEKLFSTQINEVNGYKNIHGIFKSMELPRAWQKELKDYCEYKGIEFMSTPFDEEAVDQLYKLGVKRFKISGFESTDLRFIRYVASTGLPLIISAGIGTSLEFINQILMICDEVNNKDITILHCNNAYPTPLEDTNLLTIPLIKKTYNIPVGFSDHTLGVLAPSIAVTLGAEVIEKHFTLSRKSEGLDHFFALEPNELKEMVKMIRNAEKMLFVKTKTSVSEKSNLQGQRSIIAKKTIKKGDLLSLENVTTKRPFFDGSIHAKDYFSLLSKSPIAIKDYTKDEFILWNQIKN
ncbi:N-acetylneuraminate synthase family protein [Flavobacteriaceae bacterium]|nr:N-acetylneuraminate synthase family protein [Flavobacteriaceae bacterium]